MDAQPRVEAAAPAVKKSAAPAAATLARRPRAG
jgi:hypothetical protein